MYHPTRKLPRIGTRFFRRSEQEVHSAQVAEYVSGSAETLIPPEEHSAPIVADGTSQATRCLGPNSSRALTAEETRCLHTFRLTQDDRDASYEWYKDRVQNRVENTCQWFLQHDNFREWLQQRDGPLLVTADPGCGKSVLAKYLIDHVLPKGTTICYFFFKDQDQNRVNQALCAVLHQLFSAKPDLLQYAQAAVDRNGDKLRNVTSELCSIFEYAVHDFRARHTRFVFDALDECNPHDLTILVDLLTRIYRHASSGFKVKCLMTSRPYEQVSAEFHTLVDQFPRIRIPGEEESDSISKEIEQVIRVRVDALVKRRGLSLTLRNHLQSRLLGIPHRTYLWVYLVFEYLEKETFRKTERGLNEVIDTLPSSVNDAYQKILARSGDSRFVQKAIRLVLAASRPLDVGEMNVAMHVELQHTSNFDLDLEDDPDFERRLRSCCGLFLSINHRRVYFLHQTAREFLLVPNHHGQAVATSFDTSSSRRWQGSVEIEDAHLLMTFSCIAYLKNLDATTFGIGPTSDQYVQELGETRAENIHFLQYSVSSWDTQLQLAQNDRAFSSLITTLDIHDGYSELYWHLSSFSLTDDTKEYRSPIFKSTRHQICVAAALGHEKIVDYFINNGTDANGHPDDAIDPPLRHASKAGHHNTVRLLLSKGADVNRAAAFSTSRQTAVFPAWRMDESIVTTLLDAGADPSYRDAGGRTPLFYAYSGLMVRQFQQAGAEIDATDSQGVTPLLRSVINEVADVLTVLLEVGANPSIRDFHGSTPLYEAARSFWWTGFEILLKGGGNINTTCPDGITPIWCYIARRDLSHPVTKIPLALCNQLCLIQSKLEFWSAAEPRATPLHMAAHFNLQDSMRQLLNDGANVNARDEHYATPLIVLASAKNSDANSLELLLRAGADVNLASQTTTALMAAVHHEWETGVQILLNAGADPNSGHETFGSAPLHVAASYGLDAILGLLIEYGADINAADDQGDTARTVALQCGETVAVEMLREAEYTRKLANS